MTKLDPERHSIYPYKGKFVQRFSGYFGEAEGVKNKRKNGKFYLFKIIQMERGIMRERANKAGDMA